MATTITLASAPKGSRGPTVKFHDHSVTGTLVKMEVLASTWTMVTTLVIARLVGPATTASNWWIGAATLLATMVPDASKGVRLSNVTVKQAGPANSAMSDKYLVKQQPCSVG